MPIIQEFIQLVQQMQKPGTSLLMDHQSPPVPTPIPPDLQFPRQMLGSPASSISPPVSFLSPPISSISPPASSFNTLTRQPGSMFEPRMMTRSRARQEAPEVVEEEEEEEESLLPPQMPPQPQPAKPPQDQFQNQFFQDNLLPQGNQLSQDK